MTGTGDVALWQDAEHRLRAELRRLDDIAADLRAGTRDLRWQGPGAGRFRWRTGRRLRELSEARQLVETALVLIRSAGADATAAAHRRAAAAPSGYPTGGARYPDGGGAG